MPCPSETRLQAFVDGELTPVEITDLSEHLDTCDDCRMLVGVVQPVSLGDATADAKDDAERHAADHVGRYVLRRVLGKGGMGVVYEAVDPELHRVVALKVLRPDLGAQQKRLLGEAQAMAKLSHPNVVTIHDVGRDVSSASGERVFIVMALIQGTSLRHWLARGERSVPEILNAFEQAAEGLRAAHDAGLVHRDFKPENVFVVAKDGRVLVGDFGLAMALDADSAAHKAEGSLAYMAPEQRRGTQVDARSDQYSFCLALGEALRSSSATKPNVPRWLTKIVARGTKEDPRERFPSMEALLLVLRRGRTRSRGKRIAAAIVVGVAAIGGVLVARDSPQQRRCHAHDAEMVAIWNPAIATKAEQAFLATKSPLADGAWRKTRSVLDEYSAAWSAAHQRTCEAAPRSISSSSSSSSRDQAFEQKTSCLDERLEIVRAVTSSLEHVDALMLEQVPAMLQLLPRVNACEDAREIALLAPPPSADKAAAVDLVKKKIATASATIAAGRYDKGLLLANEAFESANTVSYLPVLGEAYLWVGTAHGRLGHARESEQALEQAASSASAGHSPATAIRAWIQLMHFVGFEAKRYEDGDRYSEYAKAALESMPGSYELEAERLSWSRAMLLDQKRFDEALIVSREELALVELRFGAQHRLSAAAQDGLAGVLAGQCKARDAIEPQQKSCAILEKEYGSPHPQLALCLGNLAALHANLGEHVEAIEIKTRALKMFEEVPGHPNHVAMAHRNMARSLLELQRLSESEVEIEAAASLSHRESDETSVMLLRADLHRREGKSAEAIADGERAVARTKGKQMDPLLSLAESELIAEHYADALSNAEEALTIAKSTYSKNSCRLVDPLRACAEALLGLGNPRAGEALSRTEQALHAALNAQIDPLIVARAQFAMARSMHDVTERDKAQAIAETARQTAMKEQRDPELVARITAWTKLQQQ